MISFYDDQVTFDANSSASIAVTFDPFSPLDTKIEFPPDYPIQLGGITFTAVAPLDPLLPVQPQDPNLVVAAPGGFTEQQQQFGVPLASNVLTVSGNENIDITFSTAPTAVGFDTYSNESDPAVVSVYDTAGKLRATYVLIQPRISLGFLGIVSDRPIGKVNWLATGGESRTQRSPT